MEVCASLLGPTSQDHHCPFGCSLVKAQQAARCQAERMFLFPPSWILLLRALAQLCTRLARIAGSHLLCSCFFSPVAERMPPSCTKTVRRQYLKERPRSAPWGERILRSFWIEFFDLVPAAEEALSYQTLMLISWRRWFLKPWCLGHQGLLLLLD